MFPSSSLPIPFLSFLFSLHPYGKALEKYAFQCVHDFVLYSNFFMWYTVCKAVVYSWLIFLLWWCWKSLQPRLIIFLLRVHDNTNFIPFNLLDKMQRTDIACIKRWALDLYIVCWAVLSLHHSLLCSEITTHEWQSEGLPLHTLVTLLKIPHEWQFVPIRLTSVQSLWMWKPVIFQ